MKKDLVVFEHAALLDGDKNNYLALKVKEDVKVLNLETGIFLKGNKDGSFNLSRNKGGYENRSEENLKKYIVTSGGITSAGDLVKMVNRHESTIVAMEKFMAAHKSDEHLKESNYITIENIENNPPNK